MTDTDTASPPGPGPWLTRAEAAERLRVSLATLDRYVRDGHLPAHRLPGAVRVDRNRPGDRRFRTEDVDALLNGEGAS